MKTLLRSKFSSSFLLATIFAIGATSITACNELETKAVDQIKEGEDLAQGKSLEV